MADTALIDIVRSTFPDKWQFIKIKKVVMDPSGSRWKVVFSAPRPMELDGSLLARGLEESFTFLEEALVERTHPERLEDACALEVLQQAVAAKLEGSFALISAASSWEREGEALAVYTDTPKPKQLERAIREAVEAVTGFNVVVKARKPVPVALEGAKVLLGGSPVGGEAAPIEGLGEESGTVVVEGDVLKAQLRQTKRMRKDEPLSVFAFHITDATGTIEAFRFDADAACRELAEAVKPGMRLRVKGRCEQRTRKPGAAGEAAAEEISLRVQGIMEVPKKQREDKEPVKRVELHLHTRMSAMDSVLSLEDAVALAKRWGHKALAITDHGVVQAFPAAVEKGRRAGVKIILGMEAYLIADGAAVLSGNSSIGFGGTFVIFDVETTGLDPAANGITEIGAVRLEGGEITGRFQMLANPGRPIPVEIAHLTGISDDMVRDAPSEGSVLEEFSKFAGEAVLVAHNASFDRAFLQQRGAPCGVAFRNPVLDTLAFSRALYPDMRSHRLEAVAKKLGVKPEGQHRAAGDAETTARLFLLMATETARRHGDVTIDRLNSLFTGGGAGRENHAVLLVRNRKGLRNLYELVSLSHIEHFKGRPRIPRSALAARREGLLVGSACEAGELFQALLEGRDADAQTIAGFYDYLEIMPDGNNQFLLRSGRLRGVEELHTISRKIIELGHRLGKPVAATGDAHFLEPGDECFRSVLQAGQGYADADAQAPLYFRTTGEMLAEFAWLGEEQAREVVVTAPNAIEAMTEDVEPLPPYKLYAPQVEGAEEFVVSESWSRAKAIYGDPLPGIVEERLGKELGAITKYGFAVLFWIAQALVKRSLSQGYLVGSRGSVGSSLVATMTGITEVNPLPPHYVCPNCRNSDFNAASGAGCGPDLPPADCPECGARYNRDGYDIPFEVFLGFEGDKVPDIDLNFSGENQPAMHKFTEEIFGAGNVFRAGTISTVAERTAFAFVKKYMEERGRTPSSAEIDRLTQGCAGVKRTTGQHPGGIIILPKEHDIHEFTPIQYPADDRTSGTVTTHFDFESLHDRLVKLDILGHDDPTMLRMLKDLTGVDPAGVPIDDKDTMALFTSTKSLGVTPEEIGCDVGTYGVPEFGTKFVRSMLDDTKPTTVSELVRISGLSHGTDVWLNNARELVLKGTATLKQIICTRDDIMLYLLSRGVAPKIAFDIMESVRKGRGLKPDMEKAMHERGVPGWFVDSCKKIKYMFPKAHAVAYVTMGLRVAYYKVHHPRQYYATYFTVRADDFDASIMLGSQAGVRQAVKELDAAESKLPVKDRNRLTILQIVLEMQARGILFTNIDLYHSDPVKFLITADGTIRPPLNALPGLGVTAAVNIANARQAGPFISEEDLKARASVSSAVIDVLRQFRCLETIPKQNQVSLFDLL
jgi:DNA polymerase III subunit alpha, Gram-positive type